MAAAFIFGFAQAIPLRLDDCPDHRRDPPEFIRMTPYVVTIVVLAGFVGQGPAAGRCRARLRGRQRDLACARRYGVP